MRSFWTKERDSALVGDLRKERSAVDDNLRTRHVARKLRCEKQGDSANLVRFAHALHWYSFGKFRLYCPALGSAADNAFVARLARGPVRRPRAAPPARPLPVVFLGAARDYTVVLDDKTELRVTAPPA